MQTDSLPTPSTDALPPGGAQRIGDLTPEQQEFAKVLGQALAEAWQRRARHSADQESRPSPRR